MFSRLPESAASYLRRQESLRRIDWVTPTATLASGIVLGLSTFHGTQTVLLMLLLGCLITLYRRKRVEAQAYRGILQRGPWMPRAAPAESGSSTRAQRQSGWRLTAIEMPIPEPHRAMPRSAVPAPIACASL